jgi:Zn-dependent protease
MAWQDRGYPDESGKQRGFGRPGGDWQGIRPSFDNPMSWSLLLGRVSGIAVRVHIIFLIFIVIELLRAVAPIQGGSGMLTVSLGLMAISMASLFLVVLAHEFGHCIACRSTGGQANEILMWPLGGLAYCQPPHDWRAHLITVVGGPLVNVVICLLATLVLGLVTGRWWGVAVPNPLTFAGLADPEVANSWPRMALFVLNTISLVLLLFNLLPIFPLDGGRVLQALLWPRLGYVGSMRISVRAGYIGAIVLGIFGVVQGMWMLVAIALFGGITCYMTSRQLAMSEQVMGFESDLYAAGLDGDENLPEPRHEVRARRRDEREARRKAAEAEELDRILTKIKDTGLDSLSRRERRILETETERKRRQR